jgi:hypothetical protein
VSGCGLDSAGSGQESVMVCCEYGVVPLDSVEFFDHMSEC